MHGLLQSEEAEGTREATLWTKVDDLVATVKRGTELFKYSSQREEGVYMYLSQSSQDIVERPNILK